MTVSEDLVPKLSCLAARRSREGKAKIKRNWSKIWVGTATVFEKGGTSCSAVCNMVKDKPYGFGIIIAKTRGACVITVF